jgi:hypothetical protein
VPVPLCTIDAYAVPFAPVTLYVYVVLLADDVAGSVSIHVDVPACPPATLFFVHPETDPQFDVSVTDPPLAGIVVGVAESVQLADCEPPQVIVMLPWLSGVAVNELQALSVMVSVAACAGAVGSAHAAATAAASTRLLRRFVFMHYLEERKR